MGAFVEVVKKENSVEWGPVFAARIASGTAVVICAGWDGFLFSQRKVFVRKVFEEDFVSFQ